MLLSNASEFMTTQDFTMETFENRTSRKTVTPYTTAHFNILFKQTNNLVLAAQKTPLNFLWA